MRKISECVSYETTINAKDKSTFYNGKAKFTLSISDKTEIVFHKRLDIVRIQNNFYQNHRRIKPDKDVKQQS